MSQQCQGRIGGIAMPGGWTGHGGATRPLPRCLSPCQPPSFTAPRAWRPPAARVVPTWVAVVGRVGPQQPNMALEATDHSGHRLAGVGLYRVARASA